MAGVCTGPGPCDVAPLGTGNNWVTKAGGLPLYIRAVAHALRRSGHSESESIQLAVGTVQRWARGGGKVTAGTRARAAAALAEWERKRAEAHLSGSDAVSIDLGSITDGACVYDPKGDERDTVSRQVKGINALAKSGRKTQAKSAMTALVKSKTNRARKMIDGTVRAHTAIEVQSGLSKMGAVDLSGGTVTTTVDLSQMLPDIASVKKAAAKLSKLPPPLRKKMAARLAARAKQLGVTLNLSTPMDLRAAARDKAKASGATLPGTTSYPTQTRVLFDKAVRAVGRGGADHDKIRAYLIKRASAEGWPTPDNWNSDGSLKDAAA